VCARLLVGIAGSNSFGSIVPNPLVETPFFSENIGKDGDNKEVATIDITNYSFPY